MKNILLVFVFFLLSCAEGKRFAQHNEEAERLALSDSTHIVDIESCTVEEMPLSKLIKDVSYLELSDTSDSSFLYAGKSLKMTDSLIYILDYYDQLKSFDLKGNFVRDEYVRGGGPGEVVQFNDFDIDNHYLYILDGAKSSVLRKNYEGDFIDELKLPFRALRFKKLEGQYLFQLAPFGLNEEAESALVILTDDNFLVLNKYFTQNHDDERTMMRTPYFEGVMNSKYFAPIFKRSIYEHIEDGMFMRYYLDFKQPYFETSKKIDGYSEAKDQKIYFTHDNPLHNNKYLIQCFISSVDTKGLLVIDLDTDKSVFIKKIKPDMDNTLFFNFNSVCFYNVEKDLFVGFADYVYEDSFDADKMDEIKSSLPDSISSILIRKEKAGNPILMFFRLQPDIIK